MSKAQYQASGATATDLANEIEGAIRDGTLAPGDNLESIRQVAKRVGISPATVSSAYRMLRDRGMITTRERSRTIVSSRPPIATEVSVPLADSVRDLSDGNPDTKLLPSLEAAVHKLKLPTPRLYGEESMVPQLADLARRELAKQGIRTDDITVVSGGLDGIERVLGAHLLPGDRIAIEDPCYTGVLDLVRALGLSPRPVTVDTFGPEPASLDKALSGGAVAFVLTPKCQNPTGAALSAERAQELKAVIAAHPRTLVIEDDHAGETSNVERFSIVGDCERWAVAHSLAKAYGPDLRFAVLTGDPLTISRVEGRLMLGPGWVSNILQRLTLQLWGDSRTRTRLSKAADIYDERHELLAEAMSAQGIETIGRSGFNAWIPVAEELPVIQGLLHLGWAVRGGAAYRIDSSPGIRVTTATLKPGEAEHLASDLAGLMRPRSRTRRA
ncbi:MAG: aminotransferase class I/II-fold pyridoxal phosphate-dependent enzyme [Actinobacteria bacterium]|nr:aminotransferase class I/II-fold pyridoxal phosphate-dependent enzyme [Actinomycetota bacterium]